MTTDNGLRAEILKALKTQFYGLKFDADIIDTETGEILIPYRRRVTVALLRKLANRYDHLSIQEPLTNSLHLQIIPVIQKVLTERTLNII